MSIIQESYTDALKEQLTLRKLYGDILKIPYSELDAGKIIAILEGKIAGLDSHLNALQNALDKKVQNSGTAKDEVRNPD